MKQLEPAEVANQLRSVTDTSNSVFDLGGSREIPESKAARGLAKSIALYEVDDLLFYENLYEREGWRLNFRFNNINHRNFPLSDLDLEDDLNRSGSSQVQYKGNRFLTISLTQPYKRSRWLTVAAVIPTATPQLPR